VQPLWPDHCVPGTNGNHVIDGTCEATGGKPEVNGTCIWPKELPRLVVPMGHYKNYDGYSAYDDDGRQKVLVMVPPLSGYGAKRKTP